MSKRHLGFTIKQPAAVVDARQELRSTARGVEKKTAAEEMVVVDGVQLTREQYEFMRNYKPPVQPKTTSKEEIRVLFGWRTKA